VAAETRYCLYEEVVTKYMQRQVLAPMLKELLESMAAEAEPCSKRARTG
jgi:23S rRNA maturation mini-RNase III